ncbi:hypothetical protein, partial [Rhodonellum psychrophilum]|uniref:hypothetical protein n=1 Tax=Rhodonellum psychrophilum TaxID=336828 RepID=UPI001F24A067
MLHLNAPYWMCMQAGIFKSLLHWKQSTSTRLMHDQIHSIQWSLHPQSLLTVFDFTLLESGIILPIV